MAIGGIMMTPQRHQQVDFTMPWQFSSFGVIIPTPGMITFSVSGLLHPWQIEVQQLSSLIIDLELID